MNKRDYSRSRAAVLDRILAFYPLTPRRKDTVLGIKSLDKGVKSLEPNQTLVDNPFRLGKHLGLDIL